MKNIIKSPIKLLWLMIGIVSMVLGAIGVVLPVLPTTPFLLLASFCFAKGSDRFHILAMLAMSNIYGRVFIVFLIIFKYIYFFTRIETVKA